MGAVPTSLALAAGLLPALLFLFLLLVMDSFRLVGRGGLLLASAAGAVAALAAATISWALLELVGLGVGPIARFVSPPVEEALKLVWPLMLIRRRKVGFAVDAAITGFAVGAGFAVVENTWYVLTFADAPGLVWLLRGFGTGVMHGTCTAVFAILVVTARVRDAGRFPLAVGAAWLLITAIHSLFNHFLVSPLIASLLLVVGLPALMALVYRRSERALQQWLGRGFATDAEILRLTRSGKLGSSPVGHYLQALRAHFTATTVADMYCLLALRTELALGAKGRLMLQEAGFSPRRDAEWQRKLQEIRHLERAIGRTGRLALRPLLGDDHRDRWQLEFLNHA